MKISEVQSNFSVVNVVETVAYERSRHRVEGMAPMSADQRYNFSQSRPPIPRLQACPAQLGTSKFVAIELRINFPSGRSGEMRPRSNRREVED